MLTSNLKSKVYIVNNNVEDKIIFKGYDKEFIDFMSIILKENLDSDNFTIKNTEDCIEYINEFCGNLEVHYNNKNKSAMLNTSNKIENILGTGFRLTAFNSLVTSTGEMVFRKKPVEDQEKTYFINNGEYRGSYLRCTFRSAFPHRYKVAVIGKDGLATIVQHYHLFG